LGLHTTTHNPRTRPPSGYTSKKSGCSKVGVENFTAADEETDERRHTRENAGQKPDLRFWEPHATIEPRDRIDCVFRLSGRVASLDWLYEIWLYAMRPNWPQEGLQARLPTFQRPFPQILAIVG
jgi:hypothetical protein